MGYRIWGTGGLVGIWTFGDFSWASHHIHSGLEIVKKMLRFFFFKLLIWVASKEDQGVLSCSPPWVCVLTPPCVGSISGGCPLLASREAWALRTFAFLHARCGGLCASHKLALAASGHKPGVSGEKGPGFLSLQDLDFSSVTQKYLGYCRKWVLFVWLYPGRPSLLGWRRT